MHSVEDVSNHKQAMENMANKFIITGDDLYIGIYNFEYKNAALKLLDLEIASKNNPVCSLKTRELKDLLGQLNIFYSHYIAQAAAQGKKPAESMHYNQAEIISEKIKQCVLKIEETGRTDFRNDDSQKRLQARNLVILFASLSVLVLAFLFASYIIINRDLTMKQSAEQKIKQLAGLMNQTNEAIFSMDSKFTITFFNKGAEQIFGYKSTDVTGKNISEVMKSKVSDSEREIISQLLKEKKHWSGEIAFINRDGEELVLYASLTAISDPANSITGYVSVVRDITLNKKAEQKSRYLAALIEQTNDAIISINRKGKILTWNTGASSMFGYTADDVLGKNYFNFFQVDRGRFSEDKILNLLENTGNWHGEAIHSKKNKEKIWVLTSFTAITNEKGIRTGYVAISQDVTSQKLAEEQLKNFNLLLEKQVKEKTEEITNMLNRLSDGFMALDKDLKFVFLNDSGAEIMGAKKAELIGKNIWSVFPEGVGQAFYNAYKTSMQTQKPMIIESICQPYDKWYYNSIHPSEMGLSIFFRDITDRKHTELALEKSEQNFKQLIELASDGIIHADIMGNIMDANTRMCIITGYSKAELLKKNYTDLLFAEDLTHNPLAFDELQQGKVVLRERRGKRKDGSSIDLEISSKLLPDNRIQSIVRDITERKKTALQLIESENRLRTIIETDPECIKILDQKGCLLEINAAGLKMIEAESIEPLKGNSLSALINEPYRLQFMKMIKDVFIGKSCRLEFEITGLKGTRRWMETNAVPLRDADGNILSLLSVTRDISERKKMEAERNRLISIIESTSDLVVIVRATDYCPIYINKAGLSLLGFANDHIIRDNATVTDHLTEDSAKLIFEKGIPLSIKNGTWTSEITLVSRSQTEIPVSIMIHAHLDSNKNPLHFSSVMRDISEAKLHREEMQNSHEQLRQLTDHLHTIREEERFEIAREIHDELGQKLTGIKLDLHQVLRKSEASAIKPALRDTIDQVDNTIKIVRKISTELRPAIIDDLGLIAALEWQSSEFEKRTGIKCRFTSKVTDRNFEKKITNTVFRIFQETLTNVARHSKATEVWAILNGSESEITLQITDNGKGFDQKNISTKKTLGILGMKERATMINGTIAFQSKYKEGTTVILQAPLLFDLKPVEDKLMNV